MFRVCYGTGLCDTLYGNVHCSMQWLVSIIMKQYNGSLRESKNVIEMCCHSPPHFWIFPCSIWDAAARRIDLVDVSKMCHYMRCLCSDISSLVLDYVHKANVTSINILLFYGDVLATQISIQQTQRDMETNVVVVVVVVVSKVHARPVSEHRRRKLSFWAFCARSVHR